MPTFAHPGVTWSFKFIHLFVRINHFFLPQLAPFLFRAKYKFSFLLILGLFFTPIKGYLVQNGPNLDSDFTIELWYGGILTIDTPQPYPNIWFFTPQPNSEGSDGVKWGQNENGQTLTCHISKRLSQWVHEEYTTKKCQNHFFH